MNCLSFGMIRRDTEEKLLVLTMQDVRQIMPEASMCVLKVDRTPYLCKADEVREIRVNSGATGIVYFGLVRIAKNVFEVIPVIAAGMPVSDQSSTRIGLLSFVGPDYLVFVVRKLNSLMTARGHRCLADNVVVTALAVEPIKFVHPRRIAMFSVTILHGWIMFMEKQRPDISEGDGFQWMSRVLQAIDGIHQLGVHCLVLVPANTLPKAPLGGIRISNPHNVLMCPHTYVTNLPKPLQKQTDVCPASVIVENLVAGKRRAQASGRNVSQLEDDGQGTVASTVSCIQLHKRGETVAVVVLERG
ncbi:hypothetical protein Nmel_012489 [Mimus melanotis]